jgi:hypothetical protein
LNPELLLVCKKWKKILENYWTPHRVNWLILKINDIFCIKSELKNHKCNWLQLLPYQNCPKNYVPKLININLRKYRRGIFNILQYIRPYKDGFKISSNIDNYVPVGIDNVEDFILENYKQEVKLIVDSYYRTYIIPRYFDIFLGIYVNSEKENVCKFMVEKNVICSISIKPGKHYYPLIFCANSNSCLYNLVFSDEIKYLKFKGIYINIRLRDILYKNIIYTEKQYDRTFIHLKKSLDNTITSKYDSC